MDAGKRFVREFVYIVERPHLLLSEIRWLLWPPTHILVYLWSCFLVAPLAFCYFCLYHRPRLVICTGKRLSVNTIITANHLTLLDSFFLSVLLFYPLAYLRPSLIPIHLAAVENYFSPDLPRRWIRKGAARGGWLARILERSFVEYGLNVCMNLGMTMAMRLMRVYPVKKGRRDPHLAARINRDIRRNTALVFITRGRDTQFLESGKFGRELSAGIGYWAVNNSSTVLVAYHEGLQQVESRQEGWVNAGRRNLLIVLDDLHFDCEKSREGVMETCAEKLKELRRQHHQQ